MVKSKLGDNYQLKTKDSSDFVVIVREEEEKNGHQEPRVNTTKKSRALTSGEPLTDMYDRKM